MISEPAAALDVGDRTELMRLLLPVAEDLMRAVADPPHVAAHDWIGPASVACEHLEAELRSRVVEALGELERVLASVRSAP
jgi:hypothetical protein